MELALQDFDWAVEMDTENAIIYSNRGLVNRKLNNFEDAVWDYTKELKFGSPDEVKAFNYWAYC